MKYSSFSNELIDQIEQEYKRFNKARNKNLSSNSKTYQNMMESLYIPFCNTLKNSVKFKLTGANFLLRNGNDAIDFLRKFVDEVNLPFSNIVFEIEALVSSESQNAPTIILLEQVEDLIYMKVAIKNNNWTIVEMDGDLIQLVFDRKTFNLEIKFPDFNSLNDEQISGIMNNYYTSVFGTFVSFICALSCKNTKIEDSPIQQSIVKNSLRKSKGKIPFFTHKILTIDPSSSDNNQPSKGGSHSSPRIHLRRGHIRRLPTKNVWVNSCVVGDKSKGMVSKDYAIKGHEQYESE